MYLTRKCHPEMVTRILIMVMHFECYVISCVHFREELQPTWLHISNPFFFHWNIWSSCDVDPSNVLYRPNIQPTSLKGHISLLCSDQTQRRSYPNFPEFLFVEDCGWLKRLANNTSFGYSNVPFASLAMPATACSRTERTDQMHGRRIVLAGSGTSSSPACMLSMMQADFVASKRRQVGQKWELMIARSW